VRVHALVRLAQARDGEVRARLSEEIAALSVSQDSADRLLAAEALAAHADVDRRPLRALLRDPDPAVQAEALAAVGAADAELFDEVAEALEVPATMSAAVAALERLGDAALPRVTAALAGASESAPPATLRLVRAVRAASAQQAAACLGPYLEHPDRELGLAVLSALAAAGADASALAAGLDRTLRADAEHAARCLAMLEAVEPDSVLARAVSDELELLRDRALALLAVRYGTERMRAVALGLGSDVDGGRSLAAEMLEVTLSRTDAVLALPLLRTDLPVSVRLRQLAPVAPITTPDRAAALEDLVEDRHGHWRSAWLQACAVYERTRGGAV
jgi:hypothetical protein